ncbi:hypothetical protein DEH69_25230 [Streptomyces sp. PT12]|nr:hypothetical protein DEH69_25230 [Streptomyces sp. PT12]
MADAVPREPFPRGFALGRQRHQRAPIGHLAHLELGGGDHAAHQPGRRGEPRQERGRRVPKGQPTGP